MIIQKSAVPLKSYGSTAVIGEIFYVCRISVSRISAPKRLTVGENKNIFLFSNRNIFLDLRYVSLKCEKHQKFLFTAP
jgi:hypothetical protein